MTTSELRIKLLDFKICIDNEYLDSYCKLICDNILTECDSNKTQKHTYIRHMPQDVVHTHLSESHLSNKFSREVIQNEVNKN